MAGLVPRSLPPSRSLILFLSLSCASSICLLRAVFVFNQLPPTVPSSLLDPFILHPFSSFCYLLLTPPFSTLPSLNVFSPPSTSCNFCRLCLSTSISLTSDLSPPNTHTFSPSLPLPPSHLSLSFLLSCYSNGGSIIHSQQYNVTERWLGPWPARQQDEMDGWEMEGERRNRVEARRKRIAGREATWVGRGRGDMRKSPGETELSCWVKFRSSRIREFSSTTNQTVLLSVVFGFNLLSPPVSQVCI